MEEIFSKAIEFLTSASGVSATIAVVVEFVFRLFPTKKPLSIAHVAAEVVKNLSVVLTKLSDLLDRVLPQKVKEE